ncbi:MAG: hypothetical protein V7K57_19395 [Nostoc sp.]
MSSISPRSHQGIPSIYEFGIELLQYGVNPATIAINKIKVANLRHSVLNTFVMAFYFYKGLLSE